MNSIHSDRELKHLAVISTMSDAAILRTWPNPQPEIQSDSDWIGRLRAGEIFPSTVYAEAA